MYLRLPVVWEEFEDIISDSQCLILKKIRLEMILTGKLKLEQFLRDERYWNKFMVSDAETVISRYAVYICVGIFFVTANINY